MPLRNAHHDGREVPVASAELHTVVRDCFGHSASAGYAVAIAGPASTLFIEYAGATAISVTTHGRIFNLVCGLKPFIVLSSLAMLERFGCGSPDEVLEAPRLVSWSPVSLGDLTSYTCGLYQLTAFDYLGVSAKRRRIFRDRVLSTGARPGPSQYSEVSMLVVLDAFVRARCDGRGLHDAVAHSARAQHLTDTFVKSATVASDSIGCLIESSERAGAPLPFLHDRTPDFFDNADYAYVGGYSSALDLCMFYSNVLRVLAGFAVPGLPSSALLTAHLNYEPRGDASASPAQYRAGMMFGLQEHGMPHVSASSFGQVGFVRSSIGCAEPTSGLALAGVLRGIDFRRLDAVQEAWSSLIQSARALVGASAP
jgi:hypothetical protein